MVDLSDGQREFIEFANKVGKVKGYSNVVEFFGSKKEFRKGVDDLVDRGLVERVAYGIWVLSEDGESVITGSVSCGNCGKEFDSIEDAIRGATVSCGHEELNKSMSNFL